MVSISRRNLLQMLAAGVISGVTARSLSASSTIDLADASSESTSSGPIFLDRNENAYGPSPLVFAAFGEPPYAVNRYPRREHDQLISKLAALHKVYPEQIVLGSGSSEIMWATAGAFVRPGKKLLMASPTCPVMASHAHKRDAEIIEVPLNRMYQHDLNAMQSLVDSSVGLVYLCNPNNPTGTLTPRNEIEDFIRALPAETMVLIDEAYHHFVTDNAAYSSFVDRPFNDHRVVVTRTFSAIYGLAGLRVGYAVAAKEAAVRISNARSDCAVSAMAAKAASSALDDSEYLRSSAQRNANDRQEFMNQVNGRMLRGIDSHTNFVFLNPMRPVHEAVEHLQRHEIFVGPTFPSMDQYVRISLGTPAEMRQFWRVWDLMPGGHKMAM